MLKQKISIILELQKCETNYLKIKIMSEEVNAGSGENPGKKLGVAGFVISLVMLLLGWWFTALFTVWFGAAGPFIGLLVIVAGLVISVMGMKKSKAAGHKNGLGLTGMILSIVNLAITLIIIFVIGAVAGAAINAGADLQDSMDALNKLNEMNH